MQRSSRPTIGWIALAASLGSAACGSGNANAPTSSPNPPPPVAEVPPPAAKELAGVDVAALDTSVNACEDFYEYACGGWIEATPIPPSEGRWMRSFNVIQERNENLLRDTLVSYAAAPPASMPYSKALGDYYASCMDEEAANKAGIAPLGAELERLDAVKDSASLIEELAHLHLIGVTALFDVESEQDLKDATQVIGRVDQSGIGLPDRDYYLDTAERSKKVLDAYQKHVERLFVLAGEKEADAAKHAKTVLAIETSLARSQMSKVLRRKPENSYHRIDLKGLEQVAPAIDWKAYFAALGQADVTAIDVASPWFMADLSRMLDAKKPPSLASVGATPPPDADDLGKGKPRLTNVPLADLKAYLRFHLISKASPRLSAPFVDENFKMKQALTGVKEQLPRWKRCVREVDGGMGQALARPFVEQTLGAEGKGRAVELIGLIESAMHDNIAGLKWMDEPTRKRAEEKLSLVSNKVGYPDVWRSYDGLTIERGDYLGNVLAANVFEGQRQLRKIGKPVDPNEWYMTPPTVNAYYDPSMNQMVFPAGILQPPFYSNDATDGMNYGAIGMVMGHELTHGFDDQGRQFDGRGNLTDWWTPEVGKEFDKRAECVEKQYSAYTPIDGLHINGKLTLGENIADLGGMKLAYAALQRRLAKAPSPSVGGFTPEQQLFIGYAQAWCGSMQPEMQRVRLKTDPHSPGRYRVIGPLSNMPEFAKAFDCKEGQPMVRPAADRCEVW